MRRKVVAAFSWMVLCSGLVGCYSRPWGQHQNPCCCPQPACCCQYGSTTGTTAYYTDPSSDSNASVAATRGEPTPATARIKKRSEDDTTR